MNFSVSSLIELSRCAERYRQRYILKIQTAPNFNIILGRVVDQTVTADLDNKIKTGELLKAGEVTQMANDAVEDIILTEGISLTEEQAQRGMNRVKGELRNTAARMAQIHHGVIAPRLEPSHVQRSFEIQVAGHTITGRLDIQEGGRSVRDTKVTSRAPASDEADRSLQLTIYAMACAQLDGRIPEHLYLDYLIHAVQPRVVKLETTRAFHQFHAVEERVLEAVKAVEAGVFVPANQDAWFCSTVYCPFFMGCKYV